MQIPFSAACERNKDPILEVITPYLMESKSVLEIGSGTGQHALYFSQQLPHLTWQSSDQGQYLAGINAQIDNAKAQSDKHDYLENLRPPIELDVTQTPWIDDATGSFKFDALYTANTLHIMPWSAVEALFKNVNQVLNDNSLLISYGPFKYAGKYTSASNQTFDQDLRNRGCGSGIRDFEAVDQLATAAGLRISKDIAMPANNQCLIWRKSKV